ncbi:sensor histidine kinase [Xanthomonas sp. XNM01]|uniref:sensor histidine kinase n=1 Tax=Xanthomonas sp. XNM01 TaxID=2769289 RepID=UPI001CE140E8|nr:sensor histidine kinase [Xanthomonas sp. XNM01]
MMRVLYDRLLALRRRVFPERHGLGWWPVANLAYLGFLFMPFVFGMHTGFGRDARAAWGSTFVSIALFLPLYLLGYRRLSEHPVVLRAAIGIALLSYAVMPFNSFANTYLIYAVALMAFVDRPLWWKLLAVVAMQGLFLAEILWLGYPPFVFGVTLVVGASAFFGTHFYQQSRARQVALQLSHAEVRRLAATAERERIGRDLHDLLGHTLSLVALKSDLAARWLDRGETAAARRELDELGRVARDSLAQVRRAVTGIRAADLVAELTAARVLLEAEGILVRHAMEEATLSPEQETALALCLREAATNIHRHARAQHVRIALAAARGRWQLRIEDDGRGGAIRPGNGLDGMRERLQALGGSLRIESAPRRGTVLLAELPQWQPVAEAAADLHAPA